MSRGRALFAAVTLSACGLVPSTQTQTPVPSDGVGSFGEVGPIELCVGTARVVAPDASSGAGAVCVPSGAHGKACSADSACDGIERCVCGRCIVDACQPGASCPDGLVCRDKRCTTSCASDGECQAGEQCHAGGCARVCQSDGACHFGERCDALAGVCVAKLCSDATPCGTGDACEPESITAELHEPEVAVVGSAPLAFVELRTLGPDGTSAIYRATVDSASRWTADPATPVLGDATNSVGAPSVLVDGSNVEMVFALGGGKGLVRATSADGGRTFTRDPVPVLVPQDGWEAGWIGSPALVRYGGKTLLFYEGGPRAGIGMASLDSGVATRIGDAPVVTPDQISDPLFWRDVTEVGAPYAVTVGDSLRVYFTGRGVEGSDALIGDASVPADVNDSIGLVASRDGKTFAPYPSGPVLARVTNLRAYLGEREAAVRLLPEGGAEITFVSTDASGTSEGGLSRAGP